MKVVDLGGGAVALEPTEPDESVSSFSPKELRSLGWSRATIRRLQQFTNGVEVLGCLGRDQVDILDQGNKSEIVEELLGEEQTDNQRRA